MAADQTNQGEEFAERVGNFERTGFPHQQIVAFQSSRSKNHEAGMGKAKTPIAERPCHDCNVLRQDFDSDDRAGGGL